NKKPNIRSRLNSKNYQKYVVKLVESISGQ
ncbi:MAG: hypothetical protein ACI9MS_002596, partial [Glaciecola sp.]